MDYFIENEYCKIGFKQRGGELASWLDKQTQIEHIWRAEKDIWGWSAPILFPIIGCLNHDLLWIDENPYKTPKHGIIRRKQAELLAHSAHAITFKFSADKESKALYPFNFELLVTFSIDQKVLTTQFKVVNHDKKLMPFHLGAHPAFSAPFYPNEKLEDYYLEFEHNETVNRHLIGDKGTFTGETRQVLKNENRINLTDTLFAEDALVFKDLVSRKVTLRSKNHNKWLAVSFSDFSYLGIWAKAGAPYVCIEPWIGCADTSEVHFNLEEKENIILLKSGDEFTVSFYTEVGEG